MTADYSIVHSVNGEIGEYRWLWISYASIMMMVYPVGIPFAFAVLLYRKRRQLCPALQSTDIDPVRYLFKRTPKWGEKESSADGGSSSDTHGQKQEEHEGQDQEREQERADPDADNASSIKARKQLDVLVGHYEPRAFWFEVMECIRRLALSSMLILIRDGSAARTVVALFICLGTMRLYAVSFAFLIGGLLFALFMMRSARCTSPHSKNTCSICFTESSTLPHTLKATMTC